MQVTSTAMTPELQSRYDVIISGCGPCGATFANLLGMHGVKTLVIDSEPDILNIPRAVGMCDEGSRVLEAAGIFAHAPMDFVEISRTNFSNHERKVVFHYDMNKKVNSLPLQRTFYQPQLEASIRKAFERYSCVTFWPSTELIDFEDGDHGVSVQLVREGEQRTIHSRFLVACDGARSPVRKKLDIGFSGKTYQQDWLIIDVGNNPEQTDQIYFSIDPDRPGVTLPLPHNKRRWEFVVKKSDDIETLCSESTLRSLLSPWGDFDDMQLERKAIYTFHARTAASFTQGNIFLAGDAAHITPPFAGQGMMAGLRDAQNLSWKLAGVINNQLDKNILQSYDAERIKQCKQVIKVAEIIGDLVLPQSRFKAWVRDTFLKLLKVTGLYSEQAGLSVDKVPNHINGGLFRHAWVSLTKGTGSWFPQHSLTRDDDTRTSDEWIEPSFYIIGWSHDPRETISAAMQHRWRTLGGEYLQIAEHNSSEQQRTQQYRGNTLTDTEGEYADFFSKRNTVVIRPDKMVVIKCRAYELDGELSNYLDSICPATNGQLVGSSS